MYIIQSKIHAPVAGYGPPVVRASRNYRRYTKAQIIKLSGKNAPITEDMYRYPRSRKEVLPNGRNPKVVK
jgi:hypothetical protein